ncbi:MAG: hypothetical protein ACI9QC_000235 [Oceanicoccus sp.]|jgi:hypothetical protein
MSELKKTSKADLNKQIEAFLKTAAKFEQRILAEPLLREGDEFENEISVFEDEVKNFSDTNEVALSKDQEAVLDYILKKLGIISG